MPNITIDPDVLVKAITSAIQAAVVTSAAEPSPSVTPISAVKNEPPKRKRGRSKKANTEDSNVELIEVDNVDEILQENSYRQPSGPSITTAKQVQIKQVIGNACGSQKVTENRGKMKFIDVDSVKHEKQDWEPTERRPPVQKMSFECDRCSRSFEAYPSEVPQAFMKERIQGVAEGGPRVICERCIGR